MDKSKWLRRANKGPMTNPQLDDFLRKNYTVLDGEGLPGGIVQTPDDEEKIMNEVIARNPDAKTLIGYGEVELYNIWVLSDRITFDDLSEKAEVDRELFDTIQNYVTVSAI